MRTQRQVVDYSLQRRSVLREVQSGRIGTYEVCDASPYLKNAARFHGEPTEERCPICRQENLTHVHYIYGDELKQSAGQARALSELAVLAMTLREFQVFVVEVCRSCNWNHLVEQYLLGRDWPGDPVDHEAGAGDPAGSGAAVNGGPAAPGAGGRGRATTGRQARRRREAQR
ncbi:DUF5318 domain-containing protein [Micromonospora sp. CPCC 206060]|uniref:DUF5318 domain-containing protein n=1 Tax=Micromonospora sp. CPCC 206060 TaxID=3122406 RepID=UPI002FEF95E4